MPDPALDLQPLVSTEQVVWRLPRAWAPGGVRLEVDWMLPTSAEFVLTDDYWTYRLPRPGADRFDYRLVLRGTGHDDPVPDPTNPRQLRHPFGDRSEIRFPDYVEPTWLDVAPTGRDEAVALPRGGLDREVPTRLWAPTGLDPDRPAPLLVVHDGTDLVENGLLAWATQHATRQPVRVALLDAPEGCRDRWYAASPAYGDHLARVALPELRRRVAVSAVVGLGAGLGGLAMLSLHRRHPGAVDALALQSGTFLTPDLDPQESSYPYFDQVCHAVADLVSQPPGDGVSVLMTCGAIEENLANNLRMAAFLQAQGFDLRWVLSRDGHTTIGWRDVWSPHLDALLSLVAGSSP